MTPHARPKKGRRRSGSVNLGIAAVLVATLSGCSGFEEQEYVYGAVCADQRSQVRVDDDLCDDDSAYHGWYYIPVGRLATPIGARVSGGSFGAPPPGATAYRGGVPGEGGTVSRGGFGGSSDSFGG